MAKRARRDPGQAPRTAPTSTRGPDSACYLVHQGEQRLRLTVEHRAAPAPEPLLLRLTGGDGEPLRLEIDGHDAEPAPLAKATRAELRLAGVLLSESCSASTTPASATLSVPSNNAASSSADPQAGPLYHPNPTTPRSSPSQAEHTRPPQRAHLFSSAWTRGELQLEAPLTPEPSIPPRGET